MMKNIMSLGLCLLALLWGTALGQGQLDQYAETDATNWWPYQPDYWNAQSFTPTLPYLTAVEMYFYPNSAATGTFTVELWPHNGGAGTYSDPRIGTAPLASKTITAITTGAQPNCWVRWEFDTPVDISAYVNSVAQPLMLLWKTPDIGAAVVYSSTNPYTRGTRYWVSNTGGVWSWARYGTHDFYFRTYGMLGIPDYCGDTGTVYAAGDINKDCYVDLRDFALLAAHWMECSDPAVPACDPYWMN